MNRLFDVVLNNGLALDALGIIGLGLIALAAVKLAPRNQSWGGTMMPTGVVWGLWGHERWLKEPR